MINMENQYEERSFSSEGLGANLTLSEKAYVEQRVQNEKKSSTTAYLLLLFFGGLGAHRFYLGSVVSGVVLLLVTVLLGWFTFFIPTAIWVFIDLFLVGGMIKKSNNKLRTSIANEVLASR